MHNLESVREHETYKLLWDSETLTNRLNLARRPDMVIVKKKKRENLLIRELCRPEDHKVKKKKRKRRER